MIPPLFTAYDRTSLCSDALRTNSNSPDVLALRGLVLFLNGKMEQAKTHATNALRLDPSCEPAMKLRKRVRDVERMKEEGNTAFRAGQLPEAVEKYTEALEVSLLIALIYTRLVLIKSR